MIRISIGAGSICVEGHAVRPHGADFNNVCAAVSAMTLTLLDSIEQLAGVDVVRECETPGCVKARWDVPEFGTEQFDTLVVLGQSYIIGMKGIDKGYPGNVYYDIADPSLEQSSCKDTVDSQP